VTVTTYAEFTGAHGEHVSVHRATEPGDPKVWLVANRGGDNNGALHLTPEQASNVCGALAAFVKDAEQARLDTKRRQTWQAGDPEPEGVHVRDVHGIYWYPFMGDWRNGDMAPYAAIGWPLLLQRFGPVRWAKDV
jgi:hypothetical protein